MKKLLSLAIAAVMTLGASAQMYKPSEINSYNLPPVEKDENLNNYSTYDTGFWIAGELSGGYSLRLKHSNSAIMELDVVGGYRFNQFLKAGIGIGGRYYFSNDNLRAANIAWSFPLYAEVRGNIINEAYYNVVPYYSFDIGGALRDGFMLRPTIGMRVGQKRSAFLLGLQLTAQSMRVAQGERKMIGLLSLKVGYEF